jgi:NAD-dependent protein deacetylase/lipoamidase
MEGRIADVAPDDRSLVDARRLLGSSRSTVAFTGAGVSTASGVPDFRSPGGIWSRYQPVTIQEFVASDEARRTYWRYKKETYRDFAAARPNAAHHALARLESDGRLKAVITQNIDGLHQEAGSRSVLELHGTNRSVSCLACARSYPASLIQDRLVGGCEVPTCDACSGILKAATVSFGQPLPRDVLAEAWRLATACDVLLVLGSSLVVQPAAALPEAAAAAGASVVIVNREATPLDGLAAHVLRGEVEEILPAMVAA